MNPLVLNGLASRNAAKALIDRAEDGMVVRISPPKRSEDQSSKLHACIDDIAEQLEWAGEKRDKETWKRLLVAAWMRATGRKVTLLPSLDGEGFDALYSRTSRLTKGEMSELLEYVLAWSADKEVRFTYKEV